MSKRAAFFARAYGTGILRLCNYTNAEHFSWIQFAMQVFSQAWAITNWLTALPQWKISVKCLSQRHNNASLVQESNRESAIFRSLTQRCTN